MNKKFFAALASATMAFTASGSIAVFADDFVEEANVVKPGDPVEIEKEVKWDEDNFGALAKDGAVEFDHKFTVDADTKMVKTAELAKVKTIKTVGINGEIKGLEYFTGLTSFEAKAGTVTNKTLDFSANTALTTLDVQTAKDLTDITLPEEDEDDGYQLVNLTLEHTKLTSLDLSAQEELDEVLVAYNYNLKEVTLREVAKKDKASMTSLNLSRNALETVNNLDNWAFGELKLNENHFGALDLSKTKVTTTVDFGSQPQWAQTFYVSENAANVNLKETFSTLNPSKVVEQDNYDEDTGVLTLDTTDGKTTYTYEVTYLGADDKKAIAEMNVTLTAANPMNRLYNPNSGEHFYTADFKEKDALVALGWNDEGYGWVAKETPSDDVKANFAVYRLYNPNAGDHHYTMSADERDTLVAYGWKSEGTGWYSTVAKGATKQDTDIEVYRQYNPYANGAGAHNYTTDKAENDYLVSLGWTPEGTAWYAYR